VKILAWKLWKSIRTTWSHCHSPKAKSLDELRKLHSIYKPPETFHTPTLLCPCFVHSCCYCQRHTHCPYQLYRVQLFISTKCQHFFNFLLFSVLIGTHYSCTLPPLRHISLFILVSPEILYGWQSEELNHDPTHVQTIPLSCQTILLSCWIAAVWQKWPQCRLPWSRWPDRHVRWHTGAETVIELVYDLRSDQLSWGKRSETGTFGLGWSQLLPLHMAKLYWSLAAKKISPCHPIYNLHSLLCSKLHGPNLPPDQKSCDTTLWITFLTPSHRLYCMLPKIWIHILPQSEVIYHFWFKF